MASTSGHPGHGGSQTRLAPGGSRGAPPGAPPTSHRKLALAVVAVAQLMVALDATIASVALPTAQRDLGFDDPHRAYVVTAYTLTFAGLLLLGGKAVERFGCRRTLVAGLTGFAVSSALAGASPNLGLLVSGRALQGASAAFMAPAVLALITSVFTDSRERGKAFGVFGAVASSGAVIGLMLGGLLTEYAGWRWCLYVNVVLAALVITAGRRVLPADPGYPTRIDIVSGLLATAGLAGLVLAGSEAAGHGWTSVQVLIPAPAGLGLLALFILRQRRVAFPLLPVSILADRSRATAYVATGISVVGTFGMFLMLTYHFQVVLRWSPVRTGLAFLPMSLAVAASSYGIASRLMHRVAPRLLVAPGLLVAATGLGLLATLQLGSAYPTTMLPAEILVGAGIGCVFTPAIAVATRGVDPRQAGVAAATANTAMQIGSSLGTAVLNTIAVTAAADYPGPATAALVHGYATATTAAAGALLAGAVLVLACLRPASSP